MVSVLTLFTLHLEYSSKYTLTRTLYFVFTLIFFFYNVAVASLCFEDALILVEYRQRTHSLISYVSLITVRICIYARITLITVSLS